MWPRLVSSCNKATCPVFLILFKNKYQKLSYPNLYSSNNLQLYSAMVKGITLQGFILENVVKRGRNRLNTIKKKTFTLHFPVYHIITKGSPFAARYQFVSS